MSETIKAVIALSGGVDSSVAAVLLKEQGYDVIGIMLRLWNEPDSEADNRCCTPDAISIARRVAARLDIPFYVINAQDIFFDQVIKPFIIGCAQNITPNPCITCNQFVRWDFLLHHALELKAQFLATGHYVRLQREADDKIRLLRAVDLSKDQSYVLYHLGQYQLSHTLFPLGHLTKIEVRELARKYNLPSSDRPESQDLCFLGALSYKEFMLRHYPAVKNPGPIISTKGVQLGTHLGLAFYTIGQRKGLNITSQKPLYVIKKDNLTNTIIVGHADELGSRNLVISSVNWIAGRAPELPFRAQVKVRYKATPEWAEIQALTDNHLSIIFDSTLRDITPGQVAVIYQDDFCLGGGIISSQPTENEG